MKHKDRVARLYGMIDSNTSISYMLCQKQNTASDILGLSGIDIKTIPLDDEKTFDCSSSQRYN